MRGPDQKPGLMRFTQPDSGITVLAGPGHVDRKGIAAGTTRLIPISKDTPPTLGAPAEVQGSRQSADFPLSATVVEFP